MKRLVACLLAGAIVCSVTACGNSTTATTTVEEKESSATTTENENFTPGVQEDNTYISEFFGYKLEFDETWSFMSKEQLAQTMGQTGNITEFYAVQSDGLHNINAVVTDSSTVSDMVLSEKEFLRLCADEEQLKATFKSMGISNVKVDYITSEFAGGSHACMLIEGELTVSDDVTVSLYQKQVVIKNGSYFTNITATSYVNNDTDAILANASGI